MLWSIGTVNSFTKTMGLQTKWSMKKESGNFKAGIDPLTGNLTGSVTAAGSEEDSQQTAQRVESIRAKLKSGRKLNAKEKAYLKEKAPNLYKKAVQIEKEREEYQKELRRCRTKEEVIQLNAGKMGQLLSEVSGSKSDPDAMETLQMRTAGVQAEHMSFIASSEYKLLPRQEELEEAGQEDKEKKDKKVSRKKRPKEITAPDLSQTQRGELDQLLSNIEFGQPEVNRETALSAYQETASSAAASDTPKEAPAPEPYRKKA